MHHVGAQNLLIRHGASAPKGLYGIVEEALINARHRTRGAYSLVSALQISAIACCYKRSVY